MADYHEYAPGLSWQKFCSKYAKNNGLTYAQALTTARSEYHTYKAEEARMAQQPPPQKAQKPPKQYAYKPPKQKYEDSSDDEPPQQYYKPKKQKYYKPPKPAKKPKMKQVWVPAGSSSDESD